MTAPADVRLGEDGLFSAAGATIALRPLMAWGAARGKAPLSCQGENAPGQPNDRTSFVAHFAEVAVDRETGQVRLRRIVTAHDVGTIVNPIAHQGQIEGGLIQAVGQAMSERIVLKDGAVITAHLGDYKLPTITDIPELETVLLPGGSGAAPFSTTAIGEMSNVALPAAITNAVFDAVGVRLHELPVSAEKVLEGLGDRASTAETHQAHAQRHVNQPRGPRQPPPHRVPARGSGAYGHEGGLRRRRMRRLHRAARRQPISSCLALAVHADGCAVTTIEGLAEGDRLHPLQEAFLAHGGFQCGICTPGQILAAKALLDANPHPRERRSSIG